MYTSPLRLKPWTLLLVLQGDAHVLLKPSLSALRHMDSCGRQWANLACETGKLVLQLSTVRGFERTLSIIVVENIQIRPIDVR